MLNKAVTSKEIIFHDFSGSQITIAKDTTIQYERYEVAMVDEPSMKCMRIYVAGYTYHGEDFLIEGYVTKPLEPSCTRPPKHVHVERCDGTFQTNKFMSNIPREDIIDVKPMENNTYLVIYAKEDGK